ncbi:MAG: hypothetical protein ACKOWR_03345 [Micrococcales bacterium]
MTSQFFDPDDFDTAPVVAKPTVQAQPIHSPIDAQPVVAEKPKFFELKPVVSGSVSSAPAVEPIKVPEGIKMPEPIEIPSDFPSFQAPEGYHVDLSDLPLDTHEPMTRRQLREMEKLTGSDFTVEAEPDYEVELPFTSDLAEQVPVEVEQQPALVEPINYSNNEAMFNLSPGLLVEPTTNSIVIDQVQDLTNYTATVSETGEILTTGAIQLPILTNIDTETGEIAVINEAEALDEAIAIDNATGFISTIAPMRVTGIVNAAKKFRVIPTNLKRGKNHPYLVLTAAIVMVAIGGLTVAAFMLKII